MFVTIVIPPLFLFGLVMRRPCGKPRFTRSAAIFALLALWSAAAIVLPLFVGWVVNQRVGLAITLLMTSLPNFTRWSTSDTFVMTLKLHAMMSFGIPSAL